MRKLKASGFGLTLVVNGESFKAKSMYFWLMLASSFVRDEGPDIMEADADCQTVGFRLVRRV
jgi:hypothetical protein